MFSTKAEYRKAWDEAATVDPRVPLNLDLELASLCRLRCPFCFWGDEKYREEMKSADYDGGPMKRFMPTGLATRLIDEAAYLRIPAIKFHGRGDGIHHPEYSKIILYAREKGVFLDLLVNTHGHATDDKIDGLMAADKVMISLDSTVPERYARMRVGGDMASVIQTVNTLVRRGHKNVWVRRVITAENKAEDFVGRCAEMWGAAVRVSEHFAFPGRNEAYADTTSTPDGWGRVYCGYPSTRLMITASGLALGCCVDWRQEMVLGNVYKDSIPEIWGGKKITKLRAQLRAGVLESAACRSCTSFQAYDRPERAFVRDVEGRAKI